MEYIKEICADFSGEGLFDYITAVQGDSARGVRIKIIANNQQYIPESGASAVLRAKKPDGTYILNDGAIEDGGTIKAMFGEQMTAAVGNCRCELTLYGANGGTLTTVKFILKVSPASLAPDIESKDEFQSLENALTDVKKSSGIAQAALEAATEALEKTGEVETEIASHITAAEQATTAANAAASNANEKASAANTAAGTANTAAQNANNKAAAANTAANAANTAAQNAGDKATAADTAAGTANTAAQNANSKASAANTAATSATTAAERANAAAEQAEEIVRAAEGIITRYGVHFGGAANTGETVSRLYNAVGLVAGVGTDTEAPQNDFDNIFPWNARRRCCGYWDANGNFVVNAYKGEPGYTEDGTNGEVWIEHSLFYFKHEYGGTDETIVISAAKLAGFEPAPIFQKNGNKDAPYQKAYTPAFPMATVDNKPTSRAGVFSGLYSLNSAMTDARKAGANYTTTTAAEQYTECLYMWVEFATRNLQSVMVGATGMPYTDGDTATVAETGVNRIVVSNAVAAKYVVGQTIGIGASLGSTAIANNRIVTAIETYDDANKAISFDGAAVNIAVGNIIFALAWKNGSCASVIASSGSPVSNTSGKYNCVYRGKETPYGNSFEWISDILLKREGAGTEESPYTYTPQYLPDATKYANGTITEDYVPMNFKLPTADGYVKRLGIDSRFPWVRLPCETGAGSTTYYSDYYYFPRYATCAARVGGDWSNGSLAGPCYWNCYDAPSSAGVDSRARLSYHRN